MPTTKELASEIKRLFDGLPDPVTSADWLSLLTIAQKAVHLADVVDPGPMRKIDQGAFNQMVRSGGAWAAYENTDMGHPGLGHLQFLKVGEGCTFATPPKTMPDTVSGFGWRYRYIGMIDFKEHYIIGSGPFMLEEPAEEPPPKRPRRRK